MFFAAAVAIAGVSFVVAGGGGAAVVTFALVFTVAFMLAIVLAHLLLPLWSRCGS